MANWWNNPLAENPMGYNALQEMEANSGLNTTDTYTGTDLLQSGLDVAALVPGIGDVAGPLADLRMMQQNPEQRTLANIALFGLGALPAVPSLAFLMSRGGALSRPVTPFSNQSGVIGYHGTKADFPNEEYYRTSHFGTRPYASNEILGYTPDGQSYLKKYAVQDFLSNPNQKLWAEDFVTGQNIRRVDLNIKKPLRIRDDGSGHESYLNYSRAAYFAAAITEKEFREIDEIYENTYERLSSDFLKPYFGKTGQTDAEVKFVNDEIARMYRKADDVARLALIRKLESKGYDGFVYENRAEDIGQDSLIPFRNSQIETAFGRKSRFGHYEDYHHLQKEK